MLERRKRIAFRMFSLSSKLEPELDFKKPASAPAPVKMSRLRLRNTGCEGCPSRMSFTWNAAAG